MRGAVLLLLALAACTVRKEGDDTPAVEGKPVVCALAGAAEFEPVCGAEFLEQGDQRIVVIHHPDGGFRRFVILENGRGVEAADGADRARVTLGGEGLEITVDSDRYRLPVTIRVDETGS